VLVLFSPDTAGSGTVVTTRLRYPEAEAQAAAALLAGLQSGGTAPTWLLEAFPGASLAELLTSGRLLVTFTSRVPGLTVANFTGQQQEAFRALLAQLAGGECGWRVWMACGGGRGVWGAGQ